MSKVAVFLRSSVHDAHRTSAFHALLYDRDLKAAGIDVTPVFDGAGTGWIDEWSKPESQLNKLYSE